MRIVFVQGTLRGYDQKTNLILDKCHERVFSSRVSFSWEEVWCKAFRDLNAENAGMLTFEIVLQEGVEQVILGLYVVRGDNM